ncbi:ATP-binding protein [Paenibacillus sp. MSJ-34]|uniref:hybrid sensor histidine kinase/response regulator n=1 Tax=Paenibacillus sp. MSJ-34 TaxID=2841529 RepID=UPI00345F559A
MHKTPDHPAAVRGVLDLRDWVFDNRQTITLDGEWEFYPNQLIDPGSDSSSTPSSQTYIQVPGDWSPAFPDDGRAPLGYGSYRLRILIGEPNGQTLGFLVNEIQISSEMYANGELIARIGQPAEREDRYTAKNTSYTAAYKPDSNEIELVIHVANFERPLGGGIVRSIKFGSQAATDNERMYAVGFQLVTIIVLLLHGVYAAILYFFNRGQKGLIYFLLLLVSAALSVSADDDKLLLIWLPLNYAWHVKVTFVSFVLTSVFMLKLIMNLLWENRNSKLLRLYFILSGAYVLLILCSPLSVVFLAKKIYIFSIIVLAPLALIPFIIYQRIKRQDNDAIFLLLAAASITSSLLGGSFKGRGWIDTSFYPIDIFAAILGFAAYWFKQYFRKTEQTASLAAQLQREVKWKDDFLANTSHELRTPLHGMINLAQTVVHRAQHTLNKQNTDDLNLIITIGRRMSLMVDDLLDLSQLKENKIVLERKEVHVQAIASGVADMLRFMVEGKPLRLTIDIPKSFPPVSADEKRMIQILFNLLHNAIKFTNEGTISVRAEARDGIAYIHVADTGIGIDEESKQNIFLPYEQGYADRSASGGGNGLGLSICKQLVELHGGTLHVESTLGAGSVFTFTLPIAAEQVWEEEEPQNEQAGVESSEAEASVASEQALNAVEQSTASSMAKPRILAVDDDPVNLKILRDILSWDEYYIETATSGNEAISKLNDGQWDLVIADVMMPHMSGYELARSIRERFSVSELPILLLTARNRLEDIYSGFLSGANDYVTKPADALELQYRVRALTEVKQSVSERLRMEAAYLQAQIQPHFLFNTLNSITALSDIDTQKMSRLIDAFNSYLRISFDYWNAKRLVPIERELELVRSYLYIEKARFGERLTILWDIDPDIHLQLPPLTIQPLVENAVRHGALSRSEGGTVLIRMKDLRNGTEFIVADDGKGMNEDKARQLLDSAEWNQQGIGIRNTDRRLKQMYGTGLTIRSKPNEGTKISFIIPK